MESGYINAYIEHKGFGFIRREKGKDVFFSIEDINDTDLIVINKKVTFDIESKKKGPRAINIKFE
ncbi:retron Se72 family effector protein [Photobacterium damselae]|nr:retron Se72 family effector protein [Photobacterium damselae]